jgi:hypothetical protein
LSDVADRHGGYAAMVLFRFSKKEIEIAHQGALLVTLDQVLTPKGRSFSRLIY